MDYSPFLSFFSDIPLEFREKVLKLLATDLFLQTKKKNLIFFLYMLCLDTTLRVTLHDIAGRSKKEGNGRRKGEMIPFIFLGIRRNSIL